MYKVIIIVIAAVIAANTYVEVSLLWECPYYWQLLWWFPTVVAFVGILISRISHTVTGRYFAKWVLLAVEIPKVFFAACSIIGKVLSSLVREASDITNVIGLLLGLTLSAAALYGLLFGWKQLKVVKVSLEFETLPEEFDGYRIVQLSDLHLGSLNKNSKFIKDVIRQTNDLYADVIVFTGDLVNSYSEEVQPFLALLSTLNAPDGILSVLGNHDYPKYGDMESIQVGGRRLAGIERQIGWQVLINESYTIIRDGARLSFVGVDNGAGRRLPCEECLRVAVGNIPESNFTILLSHCPNIWRKTVLDITAIPLTLAGHTHAGQLRIGNWSLASTDNNEWCGVYRQGYQVLYVSQGTGTKFRFRLGTYAEITLITLHSISPEKNRHNNLYY